MRMPHEESALAFCPKLCGLEKVFWGADNGWNYPFCELDKKVDVGQLILAENYQIPEDKKIPKSKRFSDSLEVRRALNGYLKRVKIRGLLDPAHIPRPKQRCDTRTEIIGVITTDVSVQIFIKRVCPVFLMLKFAKDTLNLDLNFDQFQKWFYDTFKFAPGQLPPWHPAPDQKIPLWNRIESMLGHLTWKYPVEFDGVITPFSEWRALKHLLYGEIATRFPDWRRHL